MIRQQTPPTSLSLMLPTDVAAGPLTHKRLRHMGHVMPGLRLDSKVVVPGPWRVRVFANFSQPSGQDGGNLRVSIGYFAREDVPSLSAYADLGCAAPGPSSSFQFVPFQAFFGATTISLPGVGGRTPWPPTDAPGRDPVGAENFYFGQAMSFEPDHGVWLGPDGFNQFFWGDGSPTGHLQWWGGMPLYSFTGGGSSDWGPDGDAMPTYIDTEVFGWDTVGGAYSAPNPLRDPLANFDYPIVALFLQGTGAVYSDGQYPPPLLSSVPALLTDATVVLHNNVEQRVYPMSAPIVTDMQSYQSPNVTTHFVSPPGQFLPWGATCFTNAASMCLADIGQPPDAPTGFAAQSASGGLLAV